MGPPYYHGNPEESGVGERVEDTLYHRQEATRLSEEQSVLPTENSFPASISWPGRWQHKPAIKKAQPAWMCGCPTQSLCPSAWHPAVSHFREAGLLVMMLW